MAQHNRRLLRAYVDETGDRGNSAKSSRYFAMAAVLVPDEDEPGLRAAVQTCRGDFGLPAGAALHWVRHVKTFARREHVTALLAAVPEVSVNYVLFEKTAIPPSARLRVDHVAFYNYVAGLTLERVLLAARDWPGGPRQVSVAFGHVRGFDHSDSLDYFERKRRQADAWTPWHLLAHRPNFLTMGSRDGLQAADQYAGMLNSALEPNHFGRYEHHHLLAVRRQVRKAPCGDAWGYGFKVMAQQGAMEAYPWWVECGFRNQEAPRN